MIKVEQYSRERSVTSGARKSGFVTCSKVDGVILKCRNVLNYCAPRGREVYGVQIGGDDVVLSWHRYLLAAFSSRFNRTIKHTPTDIQYTILAGQPLARPRLSRRDKKQRGCGINSPVGLRWIGVRNRDLVAASFHAPARALRTVHRGPTPLRKWLRRPRFGRGCASGPGRITQSALMWARPAVARGRRPGPTGSRRRRASGTAGGPSRRPRSDRPRRSRPRSGRGRLRARPRPAGRRTA